MIYALSVVIWVHAGLTGSMDYLGFKPMIVHIQVSIWHVMTEVALCKLSMASEASLLQDGADPGLCIPYLQESVLSPVLSPLSDSTLLQEFNF